MTYENDPQKAVEAGAQALRPLNRFPWYDRTKDGLQPVEIRAQAEPSSWRVGMELDSPLFWCALTALAIVLAAVIVMLLHAVRLRKSSAGNRGKPLTVGEAERIEALPYPVARTNLSLLDQARNFYRAGNYAAAMIYLFGHQLVQLDRRQIIRLAKGKTNRQYLREIGRADVLRQLVAQTLVAFEDVFFGHHDIEKQRFEACWSRLPEFESLLARESKSA
jgi:hypothetical protein